jgi:hypothetical protein
LREFPRRWGELLALTDAQLENRLKELRQQKSELFSRRAELLSRSQVPPPELEQRSAELDRDLDMAVLSQVVRLYAKKPWFIPGIDPTRQAEIQAAAFRNVLSAFTVVLGEARNERIETVKQQWPTLPEVKLCGGDLITDDFDQSIAAVSQTALANRLDLMNARAQVVDAWRQIAVRANGLMGVLDVRYHLDASTSPTTTQPFNFEGSRNRHQLIFNGELPLVRQLERNEYRTALIAFQRSRRTLQSAEDNVLANVRSELRQLRVLSENYKIQQRAVELSYYQVENSLNVLQAPPRPTPAGASGSSGSTGSDAGTQAALTQQLLTAVSGLLQAQNQLYTVYQNYLIIRIQLYRDLELMPLDACGVWIDEHANTASTPGPDGGVAEPRTQRVAPPTALPELLPPPGAP